MLVTLSGLRGLQLSGKGVVVMDGDWMVYEAMSAAEYDASWDESIWMRCCDHERALEALESKIKRYLSRKKAWGSGDVILAFTERDPEKNWRKLILPTYKFQRKNTKKPVGYWEFLDALFARDDFICVREPMLEGDDVMGIIGSNSKAFGFDKAVLIGCDKDFKTVPNCDFLWDTEDKILVNTLETANRAWYYQSINGDICDGYSGISGVGATGANEILDNPYWLELTTEIIKAGKNKGAERTRWVSGEVPEGKTLWDCIIQLAAKQGMTESDLLVQAHVARILRYEDFDMNTRTITLFNPKDPSSSKKLKLPE